MINRDKHSLIFPRLWQAIGWFMVAWVVIFSLLPQPPTPPLVTWDKGQHLLAYVTLMFWFRMAFAPRLYWISFLVGLGTALEFLQGWSGYRDFEYADMLANSTGVMVGLLAAATPLGSLVAQFDRQLTIWMGRWSKG